MGIRYFGASVARFEDRRLLRGSGRFVDDITLPGLLQAALVRNPHVQPFVSVYDTVETKVKDRPQSVRAHRISRLRP